MIALAAAGLLSVVLAPVAASASNGNAPLSGAGAAVPFGQPYAGTGKLADTQGVSLAPVAGFAAATSAAGSASVSPGTIIGADNRTRVTATRNFPWRAVVLIKAVNPSGNSFTCTGFLYGANAVATAGHCLYDRDPTQRVHGWNRSFVIIPGANGSAQPFGHCGFTRVTTTAAYINNGTTTEDYGTIKLNCTVGRATGWFGFAYPANRAQTWRLTGYPDDKPAGTMWTATGQIIQQNAAATNYFIDMAGGQSGSPVYSSAGLVTAVNVYGSSTHNGGPSLNPGRQANLQAWAR